MLMEPMAVMTMNDAAHDAAHPAEVTTHMTGLFLARTTAHIEVTSTGAVPSAWSGQVQWNPDTMSQTCFATSIGWRPNRRWLRAPLRQQCGWAPMLTASG